MYNINKDAQKQNEYCDDATPEMDTGRVDPRVGSGRVGSGRVGSGRNF